MRGDQSPPPRRPAPAPALLLIYTRLTISLQGPTLPTSLLHGRSDKEQPENSVLISVSRRGEQGGADTSTHQHSEKPDEVAQWFNATETCAPHAYRVLMSNLAISSAPAGGAAPPHADKGAFALQLHFTKVDDPFHRGKPSLRRSWRKTRTQGAKPGRSTPIVLNPGPIYQAR